MDREEPVSARFTCVLSPGQANGRGGAVATPKGGGVTFAYRRDLLLKGRGLCISSRRRANGRG